MEVKFYLTDKSLAQALLELVTSAGFCADSSTNWDGLEGSHHETEAIVLFVDYQIFSDNCEQIKLCKEKLNIKILAFVDQKEYEAIATQDDIDLLLICERLLTLPLDKNEVIQSIKRYGFTG